MVDNNLDYVIVQDRQLEITQARLQLFGNPLVCLLPDIKAGFKIKKQQKYYLNYDLQSILELNQKFASPYSVNFTPNGDYGRLNILGQKVTHRAQDSSGNIYCLFWDLDQKIAPSYKNKSKDEYLKYIIKKIEDLNMNIQYITESRGGFHLFSFINPSDVSAVSEVIGKDMSLIQKEVCDYFEGADTQCVGQERLIRMPLSVHRKSGVPFVTRLFEVKKTKQKDGSCKIDLVQVVHEDQITLEGKTQFGPNEAETLLANIKYSKQQETPTYKKLEKNPIKYQVNNIPFSALFEALQDTPRILDGHMFRYFLDGTSVVIETDGVKYTTHGYKWWENENVLKNFSFEHTPTERPNGRILKFLEQYFNFDYGAMAQFLKEKFDIELFVEGGECISKLSQDKTTIAFKDAGVYIISPSSDCEEMLFSSPFLIKGVIFVPTIIDGKQISTMRIVLTKIDAFEDEGLEGGREVIIDQEPKVAKFNEKYLKYGLACCGTDKKLLAFYRVVRYNAIKNKIITFDGRHNNGYYPDGYVLGKKMYSKNGNEINPNEYNIILNTPDLQFCREGIDCTMSEYASVLMSLFSPRESLLAFCTFIAASMGYTFWKPNLIDTGLPFMLPHLFLSGKTKTGKSTLIGLLKNGFSLTDQSNKKGMTNTTALPMKRLSAMPRWLHLEEYTGDVSNKAENIVRLGINGTEGGMGKSDGTYETFEFKCSYIIDGERMPSAPSLINRFVGIIMQKQDMIGDMKILRWCAELRYFKDFIAKLYCIDIKNVSKDYEAAQDLLLQNGVQDRNISIYAYLICVARWFDICDDKILLKAILENLQMLEMGGTDISSLGALLAKRFSTHPMPKITQENGDGVRHMIITFTEDLFTSMRGNISTAIAEFGRKYISINGYTITLLIDSNNNTKQNKKFMSIIRPYLSQCQITYEDAIENN